MIETRIFGKQARAAALLMLFSALAMSAHGGDSYLNLKAELTPDPHAVGFKVIAETAEAAEPAVTHQKTV